MGLYCNTHCQAYYHRKYCPQVTGVRHFERQASVSHRDSQESSGLGDRCYMVEFKPDRIKWTGCVLF